MPVLWEIKFPPNSGENAGGRHTTGVSGINGRTQGGKLRLVLALFAFQSAKRGANDFACFLVTSTLHFGGS
jgi:hypothetical protein